MEAGAHHLEVAMLYAGLDVCLASVAVCIVDEVGSITRETVVGAEPEVVAAYLDACGPLARVGIEAGPTAEWMVAALTATGFMAVCLESRQVKAALSHLSCLTAPGTGLRPETRLFLWSVGPEARLIAARGPSNGSLRIRR
jgi:transposase